MVTKTYLPSNQCDSSDSSDSIRCDSSESSDRSGSSYQKNCVIKKILSKKKILLKKNQFLFYKKNKIVIKLKNSKSDETQKLELW